jgi:RND family efflux transporter MFP subunit
MNRVVSRRRLLGGGVIAVLCAAALATGCNRQKGPAGKDLKPVDVVVTTPITADVVDYQDFTGRLSAIPNVDLRARVTGYVKSAHFKEGDFVHEGDVLFEIDPRSYAADLNQAQANLRLAEAESQLQQKNAVRGRRLVADKAMAPEEYQTVEATAEKAKASVKSTEAARDRAQLYVDYTKVISPVTGRVSSRYVDPGNLVNQDNTILTTIVAEDPIYVYFDVDERTYLDLVALSPSHNWLSSGTLAVHMRLANEEEYTHRGTIDFIDNKVNANTGTIRLRGVFKNPSGTLKAGLFARIRLPIGRPYQAILIPDEALQSDQGRKYVFVANSDNKVVRKYVEPGQAIHGLRAIKPPAKGKEHEEGVAEGDRVIVSGMQRVREGAPVEVKVQPPPEKPAVPLVKEMRRDKVTK